MLNNKISILKIVNKLESNEIRFVGYDAQIELTKFNSRYLSFLTFRKTYVNTKKDLCMLVHEISHAINANDKQLFNNKDFGLSEYCLLKNLNNFIKLETKVLATEYHIIKTIILKDFSKEDLFKNEFIVFENSIYDAFLKYNIINSLDSRIKLKIPKNKHHLFNFEKDMFLQIYEYLTKEIEKKFDDEYNKIKNIKPDDMFKSLKQRIIDYNKNK